MTQDKKWTINRVKKLKRDKRIRGYQVHDKGTSSKFQSPNKITRDEKRSAAKDWILLNLQYWCNKHSLSLVEEHLFDQVSVETGLEIPARKWRFDWAITSIKVAIEYEGIMSQHSRHTNVRGYTGDIQKYNRAAALGWKVLRFTAINYKEDLIKKLDQCL